jgi:hypothetical protein
MPTGVAGGTLEDSLRRLMDTPGDDVVLPEAQEDISSREMAENDLAEDQAEPELLVQPEPPKKEPAIAKGGDRKGQKVDLTALPEFREYQAAIDRKVEQERKEHQELLERFERMEKERQDEQARAAAARLQQLNAELSNIDDPDERSRRIEEMAELRAQDRFSQKERWLNYVREQERQLGLPAGSFDAGKYQGVQGAIQFERDRAEAAVKVAKRETEEARKQAADPEAIAELIRKQVAAALAKQGLDTVDIEPAATAAPDNLMDAMTAFNQGRITWKEYQRRTQRIGGAR